MTIEIGQLQAYLDGEQTPVERIALEAHLATCEACQRQIIELQRRAALTSVGLAALTPLATETPAVAPALARLRRQTPAQRSSPWETVTRRFTTMQESITRRKSQLRLAAAGLTVLLAIVALFSIAPAREALAQFLGVFRVRKFAVVSINQTQMEQLRSLEELTESGMLGEPTFLRQPGDPQIVASAAEAEALAGFPVRTPTDAPEGAALQEVAVTVGPHVRLEVEREVLQIALELLGVDATLPPLADTISLAVDVPAVVAQRYLVDNPYGERDAEFTLFQAPSPSVDIPAGIDPAAMGELLLQALGMPANDAQRLAQTIDWTSTLVIPFPGDMGAFYETDVNGAQGLLLEERPGADGYRRSKLLLWERDDVLYAVASQNMAGPAVKQVADSLR